MAEKFQEKRIVLSQINGGYRYEDGDGIQPEAINAPIEGLAYLQRAISLIVPQDVLDNVGALGAKYRAFGEIGYHSTNPIYASMEYTRTGVGVGVIHIDFTVDKDGALPDSFRILDLYKIKSAFANKGIAIDFVNESQGNCVPVYLSTSIASLYGYAMFCTSDVSNGHMGIGRYYTTSGTAGLWQLSALAGQAFSIEIKVTEV